LNYYEHHLGDWAAATGHLTWDEDMAYTRLLRAYYHAERAIPQGQQYRIARAATPAQRKAVDAVLAEFFILVDGNHHQKRADAEIARFQDKQRKAKASADARWSQSGRNANASPDAMRTHSEGNAPRHQTPDTRPSETPSLLPQAPAFPAEKPPLALVGEPEPQAKGPPDCPHQAVLALWAEVLPALPQHNPSLWRGARESHLRARWRETAIEKGWRSEADGLAYLRKLFAYVGQSRFLTGRAPAAQGRPPFVAELSWLVNPENWAKTIEGKYHSEAA
jgi:uncharacterized protein YdaU (DUF1376 family)